MKKFFCILFSVVFCVILYSCQSKSEKQTTTETTPQTTETTPQTTESSSSVKNIEGTYKYTSKHFGDNKLIIKNKEGMDNEEGTATIQWTDIEEHVEYGSWTNLESVGMGYSFMFDGSNFYIDFNNMWLYWSLDAYKAENPKERYKLTKVN